MQGKRSVTGSLPDPMNFDFGSVPSNVGIDQQICWNNLLDPAESRLTDYRVMPSGADAYMGSISQEAGNLSRWSIGESSCSNSQNLINHDERMTQTGWSSSMNTSGVAGPSRERQLYEPSMVDSRNVINLNLNINQIPSEPYDSHVGQLDRVGGGSGDPMDCSNSSKPGGLEHRLFSSSSSSEAFASSSANRHSCKRKTIEGNVGQSSNSGSFFSREASMWQAVPPCYNAGSSSSNISDSVNSRLELSMLGVAPDSLHTSNVASSAERSHRSFRSRTNPSNHQDSFLPRAIPAGHQPFRLVPVSSPPELVPPVVHQHPGLRRNMQSVRLGGASTSRERTGERDIPVHEDLNSRPMSRNISENPMFMPSAEVRSNVAHNPPSWHVGSSSRAVAGPSAHSTSAPSWGSSRHHPSSQYSRRMSEYFRRSLLSSVGSEIGGHSGSSSAQRLVPSSLQEIGISSGGGSLGHNQPFSRSAQWMDRHGDAEIGIPYSIRTSSAAGEGRSRFVPEHIRNVLDMMRRGEGLRFEDIMLLDPSVIFRMADIHDQHRDMRLDVDNMSYEELLALEERIGSVCTGLSAETITARMKQRKYLALTRGDQTEVEPCCICQEEYSEGDDLGTLDCGHDFHTECIKQWLGQKNLCPICKTTGLAT